MCFLQTLNVGPRSNTQLSGITWLEFLALYFIRGGSPAFLSCDNSTEPPSAPSLERFLEQFQTVVRHITRIALSSSDQILFASPPCSHLRLLDIGFSNSTPKLNFHIEANEQEIDAVIIFLFKSRGTFTSAMESAWHARELLLQPARLKLRYHASLFKPLSYLHLADSPANTIDIKIDRPNLPVCIQLLCPACKQARNLPPLFRPRVAGAWQQTKCPQCRVSQPIHQWLCPCGRP